MDRPWKQLEVERQGEVHCARLQHVQMDETQLQDLSVELNRLIDEEGCRKLVLSLGPPDPLCLYSVFLAKLVSLQRRLNQAGGGLKLAHVSPDTYRIFEACRLHSIFEFHPDKQTAMNAFAT
jgi:hypothetical protein